MKSEESQLVLLVITFIILVLIGGIGFFLWFYYKQMLKQHETIIKKQNETEINTRQNIAYVLHEEIAKNITFINWNVNRVQTVLQDLGDSAEVDEALEYCSVISEQANSAKDRVKFLHNSIFPPALLILDFKEAISQLVENLQNQYKGTINGRFDGDFEQLSKEQKYNLYGLINLFATNSIQHSEASTIDIRLLQKERKIILKMRDNGKGFDMKDIQKKAGGRGTFDIRSRAIALLPESFQFTSEIGKGTFLQIEILCIY